MKEEQSNILGRRIKMAREMRGMTLDGLSKAMNPSVTKQAISKYEKGMAVPGSTVLLSISNALNVSIDYFFRNQIVKIEKLSFHGKSSLGAAKIKSIGEIVRDNIERYLEVCQIIDPHAFTNDFSPLAVDNSSEINSLVRELKTAWDIGTGPMGNVIDTLEQHGIIVVEIEADDGFDGLSGWAEELYPVIVLNKALPYEAKRLAALCELGHILIPSANDEKQWDNLCRTFAAEMLVSDAILTEILGTKVKGVFLEELETVRDIYGISIDILLYKAQNIGIISKSTYRTYLQKKHDEDSFRNRIEQTSRACPEYSRKFVNMVYRAIASEAISMSKAASLLNASMSELRNLLTSISDIRM